MKVAYHNLNDDDDPANDHIFTNSEDLNRLLDGQEPSRMLPFTFWLVGEDGFRLGVGIEGMFGWAQYEPHEGGGPFLMAVDRASAQPGIIMEFLVGGTQTPIDGRYRVRFDKLRRILDEFVSTGKLSTEVEWEELT